MNWEEYLITLYLKICKEYKENLWISCQRFTNGGVKTFTDEEVMVVYLFGLSRGFNDLKSIHRYTQDHLQGLFPDLPGYKGFVHRVNQLSGAFIQLVTVLQQEKFSGEEEGLYLVDSLPIALAHHQHAYRAKVAPELADKSFNATKKQWYYGVRAHVVARARAGRLPEIELLFIEKASTQDGPMFDQLRPYLHHNLVLADKAYQRPDAQKFEQLNDLKVLTPIKRLHGKPLEPHQRLFSKQVSRLRQPIEALFAWLDRVTHLQKASLVRSAKGLMTHIFGRFTAALLLGAYHPG